MAAFKVKNLFSRSGRDAIIGNAGLNEGMSRGVRNNFTRQNIEVRTWGSNKVPSGPMKSGSNKVPSGPMKSGSNKVPSGPMKSGSNKVPSGPMKSGSNKVPSGPMRPNKPAGAMFNIVDNISSDIKFITLNKKYASGADSEYCQVNGIVIDNETGNIISMSTPIPRKVESIQKVLRQTINQEVQVSPIVNGTMLTLYRHNDTIKFSTRNGFDVSGISQLNPKSFGRLFMEIVNEKMGQEAFFYKEGVELLDTHINLPEGYCWTFILIDKLNNFAPANDIILCAETQLFTAAESAGEQSFRSVKGMPKRRYSGEHPFGPIEWQRRDIVRDITEYRDYGELGFIVHLDIPILYEKKKMSDLRRYIFNTEILRERDLKIQQKRIGVFVHALLGDNKYKEGFLNLLCTQEDRDLYELLSHKITQIINNACKYMINGKYPDEYYYLCRQIKSEFSMGGTPAEKMNIISSCLDRHRWTLLITRIIEI